MDIKEIMNSLSEEKKVALQEELDTLAELRSNDIISEDELQTLNKKTVDSFIVEFKADGEDSETVEPTGTSAKKRKADVFKSNNQDSADKVADLEGQISSTKLLDSGKAGKQASPRLADKRTGTVKEELFAGDETISEEFKTKATAIFEATLAEREEEIRASFEEEFEARLAEEVEILENKMDEYLDYVVENWLSENEVAIESSAKVAVAESFMTGLKSLFEEHNIDVEDAELSVMEEMQSKIEELEDDLNEAVAQIIEFESLISEATKEEVIDELSEGLTDTQKERLSLLSEKISFNDMEEFKSKISTIKESMIVKKKTGKAEDFLNEEFDGNTEVITEKLDDAMAGYVSAASKIFKN